MAAGPLSSSKETGTGISTQNSTSNHVAISRLRPMRRGGGSSNHSRLPSNGNLSQVSSTQGAVVEAALPKPGKSGASILESYRENKPRDAGQKGRTQGGNELQPQRNSFKSSNGPQPRGDGSFHHSPHQTFGGRESQATQQRVGSGSFVFGPVPNTTFIPPPPPPVAMRPFVTPIVYTEVPSPVFYAPGLHADSLRSMPMVPISPIFVPIPDPHLLSKIVNQIDYYFSNENLVKDTFLRQNMDAEGWVSVKLIAGFKKVMLLTDNVQLILDAVRASNVVEVLGDKVRRKSDWIKWIMPPIQYSTVTSPPSIHNSSHDMLAARLGSVTLDEKAAT